MGEQADGVPADRGERFTDRGERFTRRRFFTKAGIAGVTIGTGLLVSGCQFNYGPNAGQGTGQSSTSGQGGSSQQQSSGSSSGSDGMIS